MLLAGDDEPQGTASSQEQPQGIGAHNVLELTTLILCYAIIGMAVTDSNFHGPAIRIGLQNGVGRPQHLGAEKGFKGLEPPKGLVALGLWGVFKVWSPDDHHAHGSSG